MILTEIQDQLQSLTSEHGIGLRSVLVVVILNVAEEDLN